jgi:transcriptional regulator with XRE-family HTH domain
MAPLRGPAVPRLRLGADLRRLREEAGLLIEQVAEQLECSPSKISRLETGKGIPRARDVRDMLDLFGVKDVQERDRLLRLARDGQQQGWWEEYAEVLRPELAQRPDHIGNLVALEADATAILTFQLAVVPGLLQTEDYARAVLTEGFRQRHDANEIDRLVELRMRRQQVLRRDGEPLRLHCVLDEAVIRRSVGGRETMAAQLQALIDASERPNITLQVVPFDAGVHAGMAGSFMLLEFADSKDHDRVYLEGHAGITYIEHPNDVLNYQQLFADVSSKAPSERESVALLASQLAFLRQQA